VLLLDNSAWARLELPTLAFESHWLAPAGTL